MRFVPRCAIYVYLIALFTQGLDPCVLHAVPANVDPDVERDLLTRPSARQMRLDKFRKDQEELRRHRKESRRQRIEAKRARLQEALEQARDVVQACSLKWTDCPSNPCDYGSPAHSRNLFIGMSCLCLLAIAPTALGNDGAVAADNAPTSVLGWLMNDADFYSSIGPPDSASGSGPGSEELITNMIMAQLESDEINLNSDMVQRALRAQRTKMQNALGSAIKLAAPLPPLTPGAQLIQGAFKMALSDTARDSVNGHILPPDFGPVPGRRASIPAVEGGVPACPELIAAQRNLDAAKRDVMAAIWEAKSVGSDIVIAATGLLSYGTYAATAYGIDIGSSVTGIFATTPVSPAGAASGSLAATGNLLFLFAYASDAIAGAVTIHKLKEPYIDALLAVSDAEAAWLNAYKAFNATLARALYGCAPGSNDTKETAGTSAPTPSGGSPQAPLASGAGG